MEQARMEQPGGRKLSAVVASAATFSLTLRLTGVIVSIGSMAILARLLGPTEYGLFSVLTLLAALACILAEAVTNAIVQDAGLDRSGLSFAFALVAGVALIGALVFLALAPAIGAAFSVDLSQQSLVFAAVMALAPVSTFFDGVQNKTFHFRTNAVLDLVILNVLQSAIAIALALLGYGAKALPLAFLAALAAKIVAQHFGGVSGHFGRPRFNAVLARSILGFLAINVLNYAGRNGDNAVIGATLGPAALGIYGRSYSLMMRPVTVFGGVATSVFFPSFAAIGHEPERAKRAYLSAIGITALMACPLSVFGVLFAGELIAFFLGPRWGEAALPFAILMGALYFRMAYRVTEVISFSRKQFLPTLLRQGFYGASVVAGAAIGASLGGVVGASALVSVALFAFFLISAAFANQLMGVSIREFALSHVPAMLATLPLLVVAALIRLSGLEAYGPLVVLVLATLIGGACCALVLARAPDRLLHVTPGGVFLHAARAKLFTRLKGASA